MRRMADAYGFTPQQVGQMTPSQIAVLVCDEKELQQRKLGRRTITGSPEELRAMGIEINTKGKTTVAELAKQQQITDAASRRARRHASIAAAKAAKKVMEQDGGI